MTEALTPEQSARRILPIPRADDSGEGQGIQVSELRSKFLEEGGSNNELDAGMKYAGENDRIENVESNFVQLTEAGVEEA